MFIKTVALGVFRSVFSFGALLMGSQSFETKAFLTCSLQQGLSEPRGP